LKPSHEIFCQKISIIFLDGISMWRRTAGLWQSMKLTTKAN
jgi:hypothetical protein